MRDRYVEGATPTWMVQLYWSPTRKTWHLRAIDGQGRPVGGLRTEATVDLDQAAINALLRAIRRELEMLLPF